MHKPIDKRHGSPYDRGEADSYYKLPPDPHYYKGEVCMSEVVKYKDMSLEEIYEYYLGYNDNQRAKNFKEYLY